MAATTISGVDHVAILVRDIDASLPHYTGTLGFRVISDESIAVSGGIRLVLLDGGNVKVQLVSPTVSTGPFVETLATRGEGLHHICLTVPDIERAAADLAPGAKVAINDPGGRPRTAFLPPGPNDLITELVEIPNL
jgi:methylmalonyl-CoA/ethylmalonyl-CoA epimerase